MSFDGSLPSLSIWITYLLRVVFAYSAARFICAFIQDPRARVRIWRAFLVLTTAVWLSLWVPFPPAGGSIRLAFRLVPFRTKTDLHVALPVKGLFVSYLAKLVPAAAYLYFFLVLVSVLHLLLRSLQLKAVLRQTQPPSPQLQERFRRLCLELNVDRCELSLAAHLHSPATCHWWRRHVLLPTDLVPQLDTEQLENILRHELIHVRQHDYLWDRTAALGCRLVFFHPLVWLGYRHLRCERELACDHEVAHEDAETRLRYAECLTYLARWSIARTNFSSGISFFSSESLLAVRVRALLTEPSISSAPRKAARAGLVSIAASFALVLVPGLGISLYSPIHLTDLVSRVRNSRSSAVRKKAISAKPAQFSFAKAATAQTPRIANQSAAQQSIYLLLDFRPASLPSLHPLTVIDNTVETSPTEGRNVGLQSSHAVWDEASMPLALPPKWRSLAIGAITRGVGMATGRIDVEDVDGPRKRGH